MSKERENLKKLYNANELEMTNRSLKGGMAEEDSSFVKRSSDCGIMSQGKEDTNAKMNLNDGKKTFETPDINNNLMLEPYINQKSQKDMISSFINPFTLKIRDAEMQAKFYEHSRDEAILRAKVLFVFCIPIIIIVFFFWIQEGQITQTRLQNVALFTLLLIFVVLSCFSKKCIHANGPIQILSNSIQIAMFRYSANANITERMIETENQGYRFFFYHFTYALFMTTDWFYSQLFAVICDVTGIAVFFYFNIDLIPNPGIQVGSLVLAIFLTLTATYLIHQTEVHLFVKERLEERGYEELKSVFNALPDGILITNEQEVADLQFSNQTMNDIYGIDLCRKQVVRENATEKACSLSIYRHYDCDKYTRRVTYSLNDIVKGKADIDQTLMVRRQSPYVEDDMKDLIVKGSLQDIVFNSKSCKLLIFANLTSFFQLRDSQKLVELMDIAMSQSAKEMQTPINIVINMLQELLVMYKVDTSISEMIKVAICATKMQLLNVGCLLDKCSSNKYNFVIKNEPFAIHDTINEIYRMFKLQAENKMIKIVIEPIGKIADTYIGDRERIQQILVNLVSNSVKFTSGGFIKIFYSYKIQTQTLVFFVEDTGIGIKAKDIPKLFKPYGILKNSQPNNLNGIGLGLNICKELTHQLGGEIQVSSTHGIGTTFTFSVKVQEANHSHIHSTKASADQSSQPNNSSNKGSSDQAIIERSSSENTDKNEGDLLRALSADQAEPAHKKDKDDDKKDDQIEIEDF